MRSHKHTCIEAPGRVGINRSRSDPDKRDRSREAGGVRLRCCAGIDPAIEPLAPSPNVLIAGRV